MVFQSLPWIVKHDENFNLGSRAHVLDKREDIIVTPQYIYSNVKAEFFKRTLFRLEILVVHGLDKDVRLL